MGNIFSSGRTFEVRVKVGIVWRTVGFVCDVERNFSPDSKCVFIDTQTRKAYNRQGEEVRD